MNEGLAAVHFLLADALLKQNSVDFPRAERHLARAVELDAAFVPARLALGTLYTRTDRYADAAAQLERAVALDPENSNAHYQLGRTYLKLGRKDEAQTEMATFKKLHDAESEGESTEQAEIRRRLANVRF